MEGLRLHLLGGIAVLRSPRETVELPSSKKTRALLGYLAACRAPQPRQRLCDLLWDGPDDPRAALRWSLTKLRPIVRLLADREHVTLETAGLSIDLVEAQAAAGTDPSATDTKSLRRAADLLSGDFLEGLDLPDCYRFHEWCAGERERVRALRLAVLGTLVERLEGTPEEALAYARRRLTVDPLSDVAHASVVHLLARLGRKNEAQAQVETCRRILSRELGGRRSPALELARLEIGRSVPVRDHVVPHVETAPPITPVPVRDAFVGRDEERALLADVARRASKGPCNEVVLLSGEPGIGKSRLLEDFAGKVRQEGGTVLSGRAFEAESVRPYGIWIDAVRSLSTDALSPELRSDLAPLLPALGERSGDAETKARLFDGVARLLRALPAPVAVVVDDLHWLDDASLGLLHYVVRVSAGAVVCATRDGELSDNAAALRFVRGLRQDGRLRHVSLARLGEAHTAELVKAIAKAEVDVDRVFRESAGNPLFAIEVTRSLAAGTEPKALDGLLQDRLARLDARARDVLIWASALGRRFDPAFLGRVTGDSPAHIVGAVGLLEQHGLLAGDEGASYVFSHELIRTAAYKQLSGPRRRLVHLSIARALEGMSEPAWGDVVHHATLADDGELTARACVGAGTDCLRIMARRQALDFALRGLAQTSFMATAEGLATRVELMRIAALSLAADPSRRAALERDAEAAARRARELGRPDEETLALFVVAFLRNEREDVAGAQASSLDAAYASRTARPLHSLFAIANTAFCLTLIERELPKARALLDEATDMAKSLRVSVPDIELAEGVLAHFEGDAARARGPLGRVVEAACDDGWRQGVALEQLAMLGLEAQAWDDVRVHAAALREVAKKARDGSEGPAADALDALAFWGAGAAGGRERTEAAASALESADAKGLLAFTLTYAAEFALRDGDRTGSAQLAERALSAAEAVRKPSAIVLARVALARADGRAVEAPADADTLSHRARAALENLGSNAGANGRPHAPALRRKRR
jgi:DNA-binding SARP family transcriptional activator